MFPANHLISFWSWIGCFCSQNTNNFALKPLHGRAPYKLLRPFAGRSLRVSVLDLGCSTAMTIPSFWAWKNTNLNALLKYAEIHKGYLSWIQNSHEFPIQPTFRMAGGFCHPNLIVLLAKKASRRLQSVRSSLKRRCASPRGLPWKPGQDRKQRCNFRNKGPGIFQVSSCKWKQVALFRNHCRDSAFKLDFSAPVNDTFGDSTVLPFLHWMIPVFSSFTSRIRYSRWRLFTPSVPDFPHLRSPAPAKTCGRKGVASQSEWLP